MCLFVCEREREKERERERETESVYVCVCALVLLLLFHIEICARNVREFAFYRFLQSDGIITLTVVWGAGRWNKWGKSAVVESRKCAWNSCPFISPAAAYQQVSAS